ncbi:hypothetical protein GCM10028791_01360 [Echinicola sediminis]
MIYEKTILTHGIGAGISLAHAQEKGDIRLQLGGEFGFDSEFFGINFGGEYFIIDKISAAPNFTIFFPEFGNASTLNVDGRYYFTQDILQWYGLVGFTNNWFSFDSSVGKVTSSQAGANVGAGGVLKFQDNWAFNPELKYQLQSGGQAVIRVTVVYFLPH